MRMKGNAEPILVVGSVALDDITTPTVEARDELGGAAVYFAGSASIFAPVRLIGVVGDDFELERLAFLEERGVDLGRLERLPGSSFRWGGRYLDDMNTRETTFTELGVFAEFQPRLLRSDRTVPWVFLGNIAPQLQLNVLNRLDAPRLVALDTMNYWIERTPEDLARALTAIDLLTLNDEEAQQLSGHRNVVRAARHIQRLGPPHVVVKRGEHGALLATGGDVFAVPGFPVQEVVDPTGAGDAFAGGLMGYLARAGGVSPAALRTATVYGCVLGSLVCEGLGTAPLLAITREDVEARMAEYVDLIRF